MRFEIIVDTRNNKANIVAIKVGAGICMPG